MSWIMTQGPWSYHWHPSNTDEHGEATHLNIFCKTGTTLIVYYTIKWFQWFKSLGHHEHKFIVWIYVHGGPQFWTGMSCTSPSGAHLAKNYGVSECVRMRLIVRKNEDILENFGGRTAMGYREVHNLAQWQCNSWPLFCITVMRWCLHLDQILLDYVMMHHLGTVLRKLNRGDTGTWVEWVSLSRMLASWDIQDTIPLRTDTHDCSSMQ